MPASWDAHVKDRKGHGKPDCKHRADFWNVLYSGSLKSRLKVDGDKLSGIPKLGAVTIPGLSRRWKDANGEISPICVLKIVRTGRTFRLHLTGDLKRQYRAKPSNRSVGYDLGFVYAQTGSNGERSPLYSAAEEKTEVQKRKLQAQLDAKLDQRLILWLHHPDTNFDAARQLIRISAETWMLMKKCKMAGEVAQVIGQKRVKQTPSLSLQKVVSLMNRIETDPDAAREAIVLTAEVWVTKPDKRYQTLRHKLPKSNAEKDLRRAIATLDRKMAAARKVRDNKFATRVSKNFGYIAIENGLQRLTNQERPEPIPNDQGGFDKNGAERQSDLNRQLRSLAPGQKISILEQRAKRYGRSFVRVESPGTTSECPVCGTMNTPSFEIEVTGDRDYFCSHCGWRCDQDVNAAVNVELRSFAFVPHVVLTPWAERARIRSYQFEAGGLMEAQPQWRKGLEDLERENSPRSLRSKEQIDLGGIQKIKKNRLSAASRKSQLKAKPSHGSTVL